MHIADINTDIMFIGEGPGADGQLDQNVDQSAEGQTNQNAGPGVGGQNSQPQIPITGWVKDNTGWYYVKADGSRATGEWLELQDADYWIDSDGYMAIGWRLFNNGAWYYFRSAFT